LPLLVFRDGGLRFGGFEIDAGLFGPGGNLLVRFPKDRFQFAPKLFVVDIVDFRIVQILVRRLGGIHSTARSERALLTPAVAVVVTAGNEIAFAREFNWLLLTHRQS